jgi:protein disulfide-isomerase A6
MKPAWDQLMDEFDSSSSVVVGDVDCTVETDLCSDYDVSGYPTIKYFTPETDEKGDSYNGGRDFDALKAHVVDNLEVKCQADSGEGCTDKEKGYIEKMKAKGADDIQKQFDRLDGMKGGKMAKEQKQWLMQRYNILSQLK